MFFKSELEDTKKHVEEKGQQKHKRPETGHVSRLCRCCIMELKRGPNSPQIHMCSPQTGFPGVARKYVNCPDKGFHLPTSENAER